MEIKLFSNATHKYGFSAKVILLGFLILLLLIPLEMVKDVIYERQRTGDEAIRSIETQWGKAQTVSGPIINIPFIEESKNDGEQKTKRKTAHFLPQDLLVKSHITPEVRKRGIFKNVVYVSDLQLTGRFSPSDTSVIKPGNILWNEAYITLGVSENRGFKNDVKVELNSHAYTPEPGVPDYDVVSSGITVPIADLAKHEINFNIRFQLNGSRQFEVLPLGKTTKVNFNSSWEDPKFIGPFLPAHREISAEGFEAEWIVTHLNRNFPQAWVGKQYKVGNAAFGVELYMAADHYQKSIRSAKYGLLFIALTFLVFVFTELTTQIKINVFTYLLVAFAIILFFSLLTALSEQIGFNAAYGISSLCTIGLITLFTRSVTGVLKTSIRTFMVLSALYCFMFILLQMKAYAFLAGNIGLFIILGIIMWYTGKLKPEKDETKETSSESSPSISLDE